MPATTPNFSLPYPVGGDPIDVAGDVQRLAEAIDTNIEIGVGVPAGGLAGEVLTKASAADHDTVWAAGGSASLAGWPVGSVFLSVTNTNPATLLGGGTWVAFATGRMLIGVDPADTTMNAAEKTGGAKSVTWTAANMPAHFHTMAHSHAHDHTHEHPHSHTINHDHPNEAFPTTTDTHHHFIDIKNTATGFGTGRMARANAGGTDSSFPTSDDAHSHSVSVNLSPYSGSSGAASDATTLGASSVSTGGSSAANTGTTGGDTAMPILNPFIAVYMWKRSA